MGNEVSDRRIAKVIKEGFRLHILAADIEDCLILSHYTYVRGFGGSMAVFLSKLSLRVKICDSQILRVVWFILTYATAAT